MSEYPTILHQWFDEVWNQQKVETIDAIMTETTIHHGLTGPGGGPMTGIADFKAFHTDLLGAFPDLQIEIHEIVQQGDKFGALFTLSGTQIGDLPGLPATGRRTSFKGSGVCRMEGDKFVEVWNVLDFTKMNHDLTHSAGQDRLIHRWFDEVWNQKRTDTIYEMMTDETRHYGLAGPDGEAVTGIENFKAFHTAFISAFPDLKVEIENTICEGDKLGVLYTVTGTQQGPLPDRAATGRSTTFKGSGMCRLEGDKFVEVWNVIDFQKMNADLDKE